MKAMVYDRYGPPEGLRLQEIDVPSVDVNEVLVKVHAASVNWLDWHFLTGSPFITRIMAGFFKPKHEVLGIDLAGRVEAAGPCVTDFQPGDEVFGSTGNGCFAEYACVKRDEIQLKPGGLTFEAAAAVGAAASTALHALRDVGAIREGQKALINGASGGVGSFAVQIAKSYGAEVTGVCSTDNLEMVQELGADHALDYTQDDFTQDGGRYDLIFDVAAKRTFAECRCALRPHGVFITTEFTPALAVVGRIRSMRAGRRMVPLQPKRPTKGDLGIIKELLERGRIRPWIGRCYTLAELPSALHQLAGGHTQGKLIIEM